MAEQDPRVERLLLGQEIADFLYREAELLDERRYQDWLALLADDIRYWMPMRRNVKFGEDEREFTREPTATSTGSTKARRRWRGGSSRSRPASIGPRSRARALASGHRTCRCSRPRRRLPSRARSRSNAGS